jgi:deoxyribodipyrimidine photo-lyase
MSNAVQNDQHPHAVKLHWMRHDLRVQDNQALSELCSDKAAKVVVVYVFDPRWLVENKFGAKHLGKYRQAFIDQSLREVKSELDKLNISFLCLTGDPAETITTLIAELDIKTISAEFHAGFNEQQQLSKVLARNANTKLILGYSNALFHPEQLPFELSDMPDVFSPFRRKIEKNYSVVPPCSNIQPRPLYNKVTITNLCPEYAPADRNYNNGYHGGQASALRRIDEYFFKNHGIAEYKITRNGLDGWDFSSRLSAFLAVGCISPRHIYFLLKQYEQQHTENDSTYWLFFELLWREFFHWQAVKQGAKFFQYTGIQNGIAPTARHNDSDFENWKTGQTGYPIVDACMRQLAKTGWMSNRGRQLVASCFVHELNLDWRYGAAYFEELLVDFDVASNYGNWLYLAGVGSDPRGHRQFNLDKQTQIYDPQGTFRATWLK